jgi:peptidylprolyl isomerase
MARVESGDRVQAHFTARFADGSPFASSRDGRPLEFTAGGDEVIAGLSRAVLGMEAGQQKVFTVRPEDGFGERDEDLLRHIAAADLPPICRWAHAWASRSRREPKVARSRCG